MAIEANKPTVSWRDLLWRGDSISFNEARAVLRERDEFLDQGHAITGGAVKEYKALLALVAGEYRLQSAVELIMGSTGIVISELAKKNNIAGLLIKGASAAVLVDGLRRFREYTTIKGRIPHLNGNKYSRAEERGYKAGTTFPPEIISF